MYHFNFINKKRIVVLALITALLLGIYITTLYKLQIIEGRAYNADSEDRTIVTKQTIKAARGDILDRNGNVLVTSVPAYNITISRSQMLASADPNEEILALINSAVQTGTEYNDSFPVTFSAPFEYSSNMTSTQEARLAAYFEFFKLDPDISASDFIIWLKSHYGIDYTTNLTDTRRIIGVRYELEMRAIMNISAYVFAENVPVDMISVISENGCRCANVETTYIRQYNTPYAAHILGYISALAPDDSEYYTNLGYPMDALVGKDGVEKAFEEYLHGTDGYMTVTANENGEVIDTQIVQAAVDGNNVYTTIDIELQAVAEEALAEAIASINASREADEEKATGGAVVVLSVNDGATLVSASNPTYDLSSFRQNYASLNSDPLEPMFNRATMGTYSPGSTFKMITAMAALESGKYTAYSTIDTKGIYTAYKGYTPKCWVYPYRNHGKINVMEALAESCNYFFYTVGDKIGADAIVNMAKEFGFGSKTGIQIPEKAGTLSSPEYKRSQLNEDWWAADTLLMSIGQSYNYFTPIQMANYVAAIANDGTLYSTNLLDRVMDPDYTTTIYAPAKTVLNTIDDPNDYLSVIRTGMRRVVTEGTGASGFSDFDVVKVAAKTGTVQSDSSSANTGVFVCYAPYDNPEIAIAVVVEKGGSGSALISVAKEILTAYFTEKVSDNTIYPENQPMK